MVDVRELTWRESDSMINGAIRLDPMEFESQIADLPEGRELLFYCDRDGEATSMKIALWAFDHGRNRVGVLVGGWSGWQDAGYPVVPKVG
jgi:rhodanese-related sulfurtransferase